MAYSRSSRRADAKLEAGVKLVLFAILGLALAVGGLTHFGDALKGILLLIVMIAVVGGGALLISKSRLMASKKLGLALFAHRQRGGSAGRPLAGWIVGSRLGRPGV